MHPSSKLHGSKTDEETLLARALCDSDRLLTDSLRRDERRRLRRRNISITLFISGITMGTLLMLAMGGWLSGFAPQLDIGAGIESAVERADDLAAQGWQLWQQSKMSEAAAHFEQAVALDPGAANAWNGLGWARFNSGDTEKAIIAFEKCVTLESEHPGGLNGLGQAYLSWREYDKAEKYLAKAAPNAPAAWYALGRLYLLTGKYKDAQPFLEKVLAQQPDDKLMAEALVAAKNGSLPQALRHQIEPPGKPVSAPATTAAAEGWRQFNEGKPRAAEQSFRAALAKDPENSSAMNGLAFCLLNSGKVTAAKPYFEKILKAEPEATGAMNGLARCLKAENKVDEAIAVWEQMHKNFPGPNAAAVGLATTYLERGEHAKALPHFEELVKAMPDNVEFRRGLEAAKKAGKSSVSEAKDSQ